MNQKDHQIDSEAAADSLARGQAIMRHYLTDVYQNPNGGHDEDMIGEVLLSVLYVARYELGKGEGQDIARHIADLMDQDEDELCDDHTCTNTLGGDSWNGYCAEHADQRAAADEVEDDSAR